MNGFVEVAQLGTVDSVVVKSVMNPEVLLWQKCRLTYPKMESEISSPYSC